MIGVVVNNKEINQKLQSGVSGSVLLQNPNVHDSKKNSFLPHICGSIFFEDFEFEKKDKKLDVHFIALRNSPRTYDFFSKYNLKYVPHIFEAINARSEDFDYKNYKETQGIRPTKGQEGHLGCTLSHFYLWKKIKKSSADLHLILEDDAFFTSYAEKALDYIVSNIPDDADLIFVNGRASEKLYAGCYFTDGTYQNTPTKMLSTRKEMLALMDESFDLLKVSLRSGKPILFSGTDGYILTKSGVDKLNDYVEKFGLEGVAGGAGNNIDLILTSITTDISDHEKRDMAPHVKRRIANGSISNKALINSYVCSFPLVDTSDRAGIGTGSEINKKEVYNITSQDIDLIRDSSISLEKTNAQHAYGLMDLASKLRPSGGFIASEKERMKKNVHWSKLQPKLQVNEPKKFFFVHIPKTGGTSVDDSNLFDSPRYGHAPLQRFKTLLGDDYTSYKCFTLVRNPWDRLASAFYYISEGGCGNEGDMSAKENYIGKYNGDFHAFLLSFVSDPSNYINLLHFKPMINFFNPKNCNLDFYIQKLENVKDLSGLNEFIGTDLIMPHNRKRQSYSNVKRAYDQALFDGVREIFLDDVINFGYEEFTLEDIKN